MRVQPRGPMLTRCGRIWAVWASLALATRTLAVLALGTFTLSNVVTPAFAQADKTDPLPSWNEGPRKSAIVTLIHETTDQSSPKFVPLEQRIATFDMDGTLWIEHPMYTQVVYCLDRVKSLAHHRPHLKDVEPFKTVLSGNYEAIFKLGWHELDKIVEATLSGMSVKDFDGEVSRWLETARHPRFKRPYTELIYQPMLEVLRYFRANGFKTYIVTGSGQDFVRVF